MPKLEFVLNTILKVIFTGVIALLLVLSMRSTVVIAQEGELTFYPDSFVFHLIVLGIFATLVFLIRKIGLADKIIAFFRIRWKLTGKGICFAATALNTLLMCIWVACTQLVPRSDQLHLVQSAESLMRGESKAYEVGGYMHGYPFQSGMVFLEYLLGRPFGKVPWLLLQFMNIFFIVLSLYSIYKILEVLDISRKMRRFIYIVMPLWFPISFYTTYVYGNLIGMGMTFAAVMFLYRYFAKRKMCWFAACALCISIAMLVKPNYKIAMIAIAIILLYDWIHTKKHRNLLLIIGILAVYELLLTVSNVSIEHIIGMDMPEGEPMLGWVYMGIYGDDLYGWANNYTGYIYRISDFDTKVAKEYCKEAIKAKVQEMASRPRWALQFFKGKLKSIWTEPSFQCFQIQTRRESLTEHGETVIKQIVGETRLNVCLKWILNIAQTLIYAGVLLFMLLCWKRLDVYQLVLAIIFLGGFLFHFIWEAQSSYTIIYFYMIIPYAVIGWNELSKKLLLGVQSRVRD